MHIMYDSMAKEAREVFSKNCNYVIISACCEFHLPMLLNKPL